MSTDTLVLHDLTGPDGLISIPDPSRSPPGYGAWTPVEPMPPDDEKGYLARSWVNGPKAQSDAAPCPQLPGADELTSLIAADVNVNSGQTNNPSEWHRPGWFASSLPPAADLMGVYLEELRGEPLATYHAHDNAGMESAWSQRFGRSHYSRIAYRFVIEFHGDWWTVDVRSRSGRFVFLKKEWRS